jgi:hypothetical protein
MKISLADGEFERQPAFHHDDPGEVPVGRPAGK